MSSHGYEVALRKFVAALGLTDCVEITGAVSAADLSAYWATADVFVIASEHEGFNVPLLEAMHHRVPVVAYAAAAVPETLGAGGLSLADEGRRRRWPPQSRASSTMTQLRAQLVAAGRRAARRLQSRAFAPRAAGRDRRTSSAGTDVTRVHQFVPTFEPGAVGAHMRVARRVLRDAGYESEIFAGEVHPAFADRGRDAVSRLRTASRARVPTTGSSTTSRSVRRWPTSSATGASRSSSITTT